MSTAHPEITAALVRVVAYPDRIALYAARDHRAPELTYAADAPYLWEACAELGIPYTDMNEHAIVRELGRAARMGRDRYRYEAAPDHAPYRFRDRSRDPDALAFAEREAERERLLQPYREAARVGERQLLDDAHPDAWVRVGGCGSFEVGPSVRLTASNVVLHDDVDTAVAGERWRQIMRAATALWQACGRHGDIA